MSVKHSRPIDQTPSKFLVDALSCLQIPKNKPVLDLACGYGRNSLHLASFGYRIYAADHDQDVFKNKWFEQNHIQPLILNARATLPFKSESFSLVVVIHYFSKDILEQIINLVCDGGFIIYESYGAHGRNWMVLPIQNQFQNELKNKFELLHYEEKLVGPNKENVTVKMVARKIP